MWRSGPWIVLALILGGADAAARQTTASPVRPDWTDVTVKPSRGPIEVDARLDEPSWQDAETITLPWEISPRVNAPAAHETLCRITYDADNLYFGCAAQDPDPASIRAYMVDRDQPDGQDMIGLVIDPFRDFRRGFGFNVTPLGVQDDWVIDREEGNDAWNAIWESSGRITDDGYVVEAAIPFKSLRFPSGSAPQSWGFFLWRARPRSVATSMRSVPRDPSNQCSLCQMAVASGFTGISQGSNVEITPNLSAQRTDARADAGSGLARGDVEDRYGVDVRWSPTSDLTANATVNPDFSQVEADAPQLQTNQQFALFFPERRPFFLEGAEFFETPLRAVFTRTIADPSWGTKVTGKIGPWATGILAARDETTNLLVPGPQSSRSFSLASGHTAVMGRARRDIGRASTVGGLFTSRDGGGYSNLVLGADASVRIHPTTTLTGQVLRSRTAYPDQVADALDQPAGAFTGWGGRASAAFATRDWDVATFVQRLDPGLRADGGFITATDLEQFDVRGTRSFWKDDHPFLTRFRTTVGGGHVRRTDGTLLHEFVFTSLSAEGPLQSELTFNPDLFRRQFEGERFVLERLNVFGTVQPTGRVSFDLFWQFGEELDFSNAREAGLLRLSQTLGLRLGRRVDLELDYTFKRLTHEGHPISTERVGQIRGLYHFSTRAFLRAIVQARDVERTTALFRNPVDPRSRTLDSQLLFSYELNPQSVLFLGYSDGRVGVRENQDPTGLDLTQTSRTFFLKLSYAWRP